MVVNIEKYKYNIVIELNKMNRNDSPRNKLYDILKDIIIKNQFETISKDFIDSLNLNETISLTNIFYKDHNYFYKGYPCGNYVKIIAKVFELWNSLGSFPINFYSINGLNDETQGVIEQLNTKTHIINMIMNHIQNNSLQQARQIAANFFDSVGIRGILTILGVRSTIGSTEGILIKKSELLRMFNVTYQKHNSKTAITVGARALSKHFDRNKDNFWFCNGTEQQRNSQAEEVFHKIMDGCVWINIHYLPNKTKVLEIRNFNGYGMRWNYFGGFRGLVEPEDKTL